MTKKFDGLVLLISAVLVPLIWLLALGWSTDFMIGAYDNVQSVVIVFYKMIQAGGDWESFIHDYGQMGGIPLHTFIGTPFFLILFSKLGLSAPIAVSLCYIFAQILLGYIGVRGTYDFSRFVFGEDQREKFLKFSPFIILFFAFIPVLGWRLLYGHYILLHSALFVISLFSFLLTLKNKDFSIFQFLVVTYLGLSAVPVTNQQILVYSLIFGLPLFLVVLFHKKEENNWKDFLPLIVLLGGVLLWSLPHLSEIIRFVFSTDAARSIDGEPQAFSYLILEFQDLLRSLFTSKELAPKRDFYELHEMNYPMGAMLLALGLFPFKEKGKFALKLGLSLFLPLIILILFSLNIELFVSGFYTVLPILKSFRIPPRVLMVFIPVISIIALSCLIYRIEEIEWKKLLVFCLAGLIPFLFVHSLYLETVTWISLLISVLLFYLSKKQERVYLLILSIVLLAFNNLSSFKERIPEYVNVADSFEKTDKVRGLLSANLPQLTGPLERMGFGMNDVAFRESTGMAVGIPSVDGYWRTGSRFLKLYFALRGAPYVSSALRISLTDKHPSFKGLATLYNITHLGNFNEKGVSMIRNANTLGKIWFPLQTRTVSGYSELAGTINSSGVSALRQNLLLNGEEKIDTPKVNLNCAASKIEKIHHDKDQALLSISLNSANECSMILSTSYYSNLKAVSYGNGVEKNLKTFPAYGPLLGVEIPKGQQTIVIQPKQNSKGLLKFFSWLGVLILFGFLGWRLKSTRT